MGGTELNHAEEAAVIEAETKEIQAVAQAGRSGVIAYAISHPLGVVTIIMALVLLIIAVGFAFSGYEKGADGSIKKSAIEMRKP